MYEASGTITVFNSHINANGLDDWSPTILQGVSVFINTETKVVDEGLSAADKGIIRVPNDVQTSSAYVDYKTYANTGSVSGLYTFKEGDLIVPQAVASLTPLTPKDLKQTYPVVLTVAGISDNRNRPRGGHIKVVCK